MGDLIPHPGSSAAAAGGALILQDPEHLAKLREERIEEVKSHPAVLHAGWLLLLATTAETLSPRHHVSM